MNKKQIHWIGIALIVLGLLMIPIDSDITASVFVWIIGIGCLFINDSDIDKYCD